jgi:AAA15 family ATPase/GTPase
MQCIRKIRLKNFRSVLGEVWIDLGAGGKNAFVYGENGSGKSTLCRALALSLEAADRRRKTDIGVFQNLYATDAEAEIEVVF